jgi:hypothetical protein
MEKKSKGLNIVSIIFLCIDIVCLLGFTLFIVFVVRRMSPMYEDFKRDLPTITRIAPSSHYIFIILALILLIKEKLKKKLVTLLINIAVFIMLVFGGIPFLACATILPIHKINKILETEGVFDTEKIRGYDKCYDINGSEINRESIMSGEKDGMWIHYWEKGKAALEVPYKNGKIDGIAKSYDFNGNMLAEITYKDGKKEGILRHYDKNGNLMKEEIYKDDKLISSKSYSPAPK